MDEVTNLQLKWHTDRITFLCGSDGGLKDSIGTSRYALIDSESDTPFVMGHSAENQVDLTTPSSTRQELLGHLAVVYWVEHCIRTLGGQDTLLQYNLLQIVKPA